MTRARAGPSRWNFSSARTLAPSATAAQTATREANRSRLKTPVKLDRPAAAAPQVGRGPPDASGERRIGAVGDRQVGEDEAAAVFGRGEGGPGRQKLVQRLEELPVLFRAQVQD